MKILQMHTPDIKCREFEDDLKTWFLNSIEINGFCEIDAVQKTAWKSQKTWKNS